MLPDACSSPWRVVSSGPAPILQQIATAIVVITQTTSSSTSAVPTVIGLKNGEVVDKFVGLVDEDKLSAFISKLRG